MRAKRATATAKNCKLCK